MTRDDAEPVRGARRLDDVRYLRFRLTKHAALSLIPDKPMSPRTRAGSVVPGQECVADDREQSGARRRSVLAVTAALAASTSRRGLRRATLARRGAGPAATGDGGAIHRCARRDQDRAEVARHPVTTPGSPRVDDSQYPPAPPGAQDRTPKARTAAEAQFLAIRIR